ncbi:hypothetical protein LINPERPRIM_LOCUS27251, partial [Linum perenne]
RITNKPFCHLFFVEYKLSEAPTGGTVGLVVQALTATLLLVTGISCPYIIGPLVLELRACFLAFQTWAAERG